MTTYLTSIVNNIKTFLIVGISLIGIIYLQESSLKKQNQSLTQEDKQNQEKQEKVQLNLIGRFPALGFDNILADWLYLQFIQYFGDAEARQSIGYRLSPDYFTQIINRDPRFVDAILKLDTATSIFAGYPEQSVKLLDKSLNTIPSNFKSPGTLPYYLAVYKGVNELLFLGKPQLAEKSYRKASVWAKHYDDPQSQYIVNRTQQMADFLAKNPQSKVPQIGAWIMVLSNNSDPRTIQRAVNEIRALGGEVSMKADGSLSVRVPNNVK